jgi:hypothetical protein
LVDGPRLRQEKKLIPDARKTYLIAAGLFLLQLVCNYPFFLPGESPYRDSIEAGYASMAHFVSRYPDPFGWNPTQYFGLPTQMWYLPGVPYAVALAIKLAPFLTPEHVHRIVVTTAANLVPVTTFLFAAYFMQSRLYALIAALAYTFFSPAYYYFYALDTDRGLAQIPWRLQTLLKYGEGPHNAGLALLPLALLAAWRAAVRRSYSDIFLTAVLFAAIALTNWVAAMALAWCCLMMLLTGVGTAHETGFLARRLLAAAGLAYLFASFWLTPSFVRTVALNWPKDAFGYQLETAKILLLVALVTLPFLIRLAFLKAPSQFYLCFLTLCAFGFTFVAAAHYRFNLGPIPESRRYTLEAEMFVFVLLAELLRHVMKMRTLFRAAAVVLAAWMIYEGRSQLAGFPFRAWERLRPSPRESTIEYQVASALDRLEPEGRVLVLGGTRFRLNAWFLLPQVGGTFESGLTNRTSIDVLYSLKTGIGIPEETRAAVAVLQLRASGVEYLAVHGPNSREHWRDFAANPLPWDEIIERVWHAEDDSIYRVPFSGYAHLARAGEVLTHLPIESGVEYAKPFLAAIADPSRPRVAARWKGASRMSIEGDVPEGFLMPVLVSHDPGWRAVQDGVEIPIERDGAGFLVLRPRPARTSTVELVFQGSIEQKVFTGISALVWLVAIRFRFRSGKCRA